MEAQKNVIKTSPIWCCFCQKMLPQRNVRQNNRFPTLHTPTHTSLTRDTKSAHHSLIFLKSQVLACKMVLSAQELYAIERMAVAGMGNKKIRPRWACRNRQRSGGCRGCARKARWCRTTWGAHVARRLVCVLLPFVLSPDLSNYARFVRLFSGSDDKIRRVILPRCLLLEALQTHHTVQSFVFPSVCKHLAWSAAAAASRGS